jgi:hypothetical protein
MAPVAEWARGLWLVAGMKLGVLLPQGWWTGRVSKTPPGAAVESLCDATVRTVNPLPALTIPDRTLATAMLPGYTAAENLRCPVSVAETLGVQRLLLPATSAAESCDLLIRT